MANPTTKKLLLIVLLITVVVLFAIGLMLVFIGVMALQPHTPPLDPAIVKQAKISAIAGALGMLLCLRPLIRICKQLFSRPIA